MRGFKLQLGGIDSRKALIGAFLCAAYLLTLAASLALTPRHGIPPLWPCTAFIAAMVLLLERRLLWIGLAVALVGSAPLLMHYSVRWEIAAFRVLFNLGEGLLAGYLGRWALGPRRLLRTAGGFARLQLLAILPAVAFNLVVRDAGMRLLGAGSAAMAWHAAFLPHLLGVATVLPAMMLLFQPSAPEVKRSRLETGLILAALAVIGFLMVRQQHMPVAFIMSPMLLLVAVRLGPRGAVFGNLMLDLIYLPSTVAGNGAYTLHPDWGLQQRALIYQAMCLSSLAAVSLAAFMVAEQARLRRLLTSRAVAARDARRRALTASRAKSDFLATMSHEIRTPMNSILGFTQVLLNDPGVSAATRERVEVIAQAGDSLMTVLNDILDFSKVEAGQIALHIDPVDVGACAAHALEILQGPAQAKGLALRLEAEGVEGLFETDGQRLRQILLNLLNNAVKFTGEGHVLLSVAYDEALRTLRFEVRDSGIGIDPQMLGRLFTRFSQADSSTTRDYGGTGLGLAICKGLVERMGGRIGVESRPAIGSTFWFELPAVRLAAAATGQREARPAAEPLHGRVLLVDDHPMNRMLGETLLGLLGCEVDLAASGEEAVEAACQMRYGAILMDVHMPKMDGLAATRAIRAGGGLNAQTPIIAMSADVMARNLEDCRKAGMVDHIAKPVQLPVMHTVLRRWMGDQARRSAA
jgi:signal transduction histidine kinase/ActR/RegA family two-component response regulator